LNRPTADLSVVVVDDAEMARLNQTYRAVAGPTDVLAFPMQEGRFARLAPECLGDVVISAETAARQASDGVRAELALLLAHGILHLIGYDHGTTRERTQMWKKQRALLADAGLAVPPAWGGKGRVRG
jgi:probable rRNA maturation factor